MKQRPRIYYTESQKVIMWERWRKGESLQRISELFDRNIYTTDTGRDWRDTAGAAMPFEIGTDFS